MSDLRWKKTKLFFEMNGKCEYCGCDMILSYAIGHTVKKVPNKLATIDHKYNRDHQLRNEYSDERRLFIVCKKCNGEKSKVEANLQISNGIEKIVSRIIPKDKWSDETFKEKIATVLEREMLLSKENSHYDKEILRLTNLKSKNSLAISKAAKYRQLLLKNQESEQTITNPNH